ncbi:MAG: proton-conducting transporter transmembrane domain-containing protein, partial [Planctomycetota bacterium]
QLGYMFLAAGVGAYSAAIFHLVTHAFFKALLFLGSGAVILAMHHEQNTDKMGGLRQYIPRTHLVFGIGVIAIAGLPYIASGFFSKDEILLSAYLAHHVPGYLALYAIGVLTAGITAFYMFRVHFRTFFGECRAPDEVRSHIHEPKNVVLVPLYVLAFLAIFGGYLGPSEAFVGLENANSLGNFLLPALTQEAHHAAHSTEYALAGLATGIVLVGILLAYLLYVRRPELPGRIASSLGGLSRAVANKYYVDEIYDALIVRPLVVVSDKVFFRGIDATLIDEVGANGSARAVRSLASDVFKYLQSGLAQGYLFLMVVGTLAIIGYLTW